MSGKRAKKLDLFCWKCHKSETNISCNRCERSFHHKCISITKDFKDFASNWICRECVDTDVPQPPEDPNCPLDGIKLQQLMLSSFKVISKSADYYFNSDNCFVDKRVQINANLIINPINMKKIENKLNNFEYKSFRQMVSDFSWILHNAIVGQLESGLLENARFLLSKVKQELKDFEECVHCFINYYNTPKTLYYSWFSRPCPRMHPLVWAKVRGHPFWPSKVIKPMNSNNTVLVRFFGTHEKSWVKESSCYLLSKKSPKDSRDKELKMNKLFESAIEELNYHIKYLNNEYVNWFQYYPRMTPFSIENMLDSNTTQTVLKANSDQSVDKNIGSKKCIETEGQKPLINEEVKHRKRGRPPKNPKASESVATKGKELKSETNSNPIQISYISSEPTLKPKPIIEIIEFRSQPKPSIESELNTNLKNAVKEEANDMYIQTNINQEYNYREKSQEESQSHIPQHFHHNSHIEDICQTKQNIVDKNIRSKRDNSPANEKNSLEMNKLMQKLKQKNRCLENKIKTNQELHEIKTMEMKEKFDSELEAIKRSAEDERQRAIVEERNKQMAINSKCLTEMKNNFEFKISQLTAKHDLEIRSLEQKWIQELKKCKTKIWCSHCLTEAQLYCCSHTYYCTTDCQQRHWDSHKTICTQKFNIIDT